MRGTCWLFAFALAIAPATIASEQVGIQTRDSNAAAGLRAAQRPITDFVAAQGTYCVDDGMGGCLLFVPPVANFLGWVDLATGLGASVDYAGLADQWAGGALGTTFAGTINERPLADGRAEVKVLLHTSNALSWVVDLSTDPDFATAPLLFGSRAPDVANDGAPPALGDSFFSLTFIATAPGAPMPDLMQLLFEPLEGQQVVAASFVAHADGLFQAASGLDGSPGRLTVVQRGLFMTPFKGAVGDGFPVERVRLQPVDGD